MKLFLVLLVVVYAYLAATTPDIDWGYELVSLLVVATIWTISKTLDDV